MTAQEILSRFVGVNDIRFYLNNIIRRPDFFYATNGHIAVRMPIQENVEAYESDHPRNIADLFIERKSDTWVEFPTLPEGEKCKFCDGTGLGYECDECDGEGEFEYGSHTYDCKECDGSGQISNRYGIDRSEKTKCNKCDGKKLKPYQGIRVGGSTYDLKYLKDIADLPGMRIAVPVGPMATAYFTFDGGEGILMPMRD